MPKYTFGPHYGGISEDDTLVRQGQILYSEGMDLTSNSQFITLAPRGDTYLATSGEIESAYHLKSDIEIIDYMLFCDDSRNLYRDNNTTPVWTAERIYGFWHNSTYLFMIDSSEDIHRIALSDTSNSDWTTYITQVSSQIPTSLNNFYPIVTGEQSTFIAAGNKIYENDNSASSNSIINTFSFVVEEIVGMTRLGNVIKIYSSDGFLYLWDGVSNSFSEKINLGVRIHFVTQIANIDYIISSGVLYAVSGYSLQPLFYNFYSDIFNSDKVRITGLQKDGIIAHIKGIFYMPGGGVANLNSDTDSFGEDCVITFGQKLTTLPNSLNNFLIKPSIGNKYSVVYGVWVRQNPSSAFNDQLYVSYENDLGNNYVDKYDIADGNEFRGNKGVLVYPTFTGNAPHQKKKLTEIKVRCNKPKSAGFDMEFFYIDKQATGDNLIPIKTNYSIDEDDIEQIYTFKVDHIFYDITLAVVFKQSGTVVSKRDAFRYYNLTIKYDDIDKD